MQPKNKELRKNHTNLLRTQVKQSSFISGILLLAFSLVFMVLAIVTKEFKQIKQTIRSNVFYASSLALYAGSILGPYALSKKYPVAIEMITPMLAFFYILICSPTFYSGTLVIDIDSRGTVQNIGYILCFWVSQFHSATYSVSLISRGVMWALLLYLGLKRSLAGELSIRVALGNFLLCLIGVEELTYNNYIRQINLFMVSERYKQQEKQISEILYNIQTNVLVLNDGKKFFKTKCTRSLKKLLAFSQT